MNKTKIDWCDSSWNPVTGCLHGCEYCYARKIAERFGLSFMPSMSEIIGCKYDSPMGQDTMLELRVPFTVNRRIQPYPAAFLPTFHRYRLGEPALKTKAQNIFVCSMADLFGEWVPDEWIEDVFAACEAAPQHRYLFLTKNPAGIEKSIDNIACEERGCAEEIIFYKNFWFGTTITCDEDVSRVEQISALEEGHRFLSVEPLLGPIQLSFDKERCPVCGSSAVYFENPRTSTEMPWYCDSCGEWESKDGSELKSNIEWVIIGAETGNRKGKVTPKREWIDNIVAKCKEVNIPVFMKSSLHDIMNDDFIQEYPWKATT